MLSDGLGQIYKKVVLLQALLAVISFFVAYAFDGPVAAMSAGVGGGAVMIGSLMYAGMATKSSVTAKSAGRILGRHLLAEAAKVTTILVVMLISLASGWFAPGWLIAAMAITLLGNWLALLFIR